MNLLFYIIVILAGLVVSYILLREREQEEELLIELVRLINFSSTETKKKSGHRLRPVRVKQQQGRVVRVLFDSTDPFFCPQKNKCSQVSREFSKSA